MRRLTRAGSKLLVLLILFACKKEETADPPRLPCTAPYVAPIPADTYSFPLRPGMPAWASLPNSQAMVEACQVPDETLRTMSTKGLVATCLDYPLLPSLLASPSLQQGLRFQLESFNGFVALGQRSDAGGLLLDRYQLMTPACLPEPIQWGDYSLRFSHVELLLAQDEYLRQLTAKQRQALLREALIKYDDKKPLIKEVYGVFGLKTAVFVMARVMLLQRYSPFERAVSTNPALKLFVSDVELSGQPQTLDLVIEHAKNFN